MRRLLLLLLLLALAGLSCANTLATIRLERDAATTIAKATPLETLVSSVGFGDFVSMDLTTASELENQGVAPGDINSVRLVLFDLAVTSPADGDLSWIDSLELWVEAPDLPRVLVASQSDFPAGEALVSFDLEDVDLTDYVVSEAMTLETEVEGRRPDNEDHDVLATFALRIEVTGQGACNFIQRQ